MHACTHAAHARSPGLCACALRVCELRWLVDSMHMCVCMLASACMCVRLCVSVHVPAYVRALVALHCTACVHVPTWRERGVAICDMCICVYSFPCLRKVASLFAIVRRGQVRVWPRGGGGRQGRGVAVFHLISGRAPRDRYVGGWQLLPYVHFAPQGLSIGLLCLTSQGRVMLPCLFFAAHCPLSCGGPAGCGDRGCGGLSCSWATSC